MNLPNMIEPVLALVIGILIPFRPGIAPLLVAIYLVVIGVLGISRGL